MSYAPAYMQVAVQGSENILDFVMSGSAHILLVVKHA